MAAPSRAHLHAIKNRKKGLNEEHQTPADNQIERDIDKVAAIVITFLFSVIVKCGLNAFEFLYLKTQIFSDI